MERDEAMAVYVGSSKTLKDMASETGIPKSTLSRWCKEDNWVSKRIKARTRAQKKAMTGAVNRKAKELEKLMAVAGDAEEALTVAVNQMLQALAAGDEIKQGKQLISGMADGYRARNMESLMNAISKATETRMTLCGILNAKDRETLDLMRKRQALEERKTDERSDTGKSVEITMEIPEGYAE